MLYGECSLNPLLANELQLAEEEMKGFKIPSANKIAKKRRSGAKKLKVGDTSAIDRVTSGLVATSVSIESSPKTVLGHKRDREEEDVQLMVRIPHSASSYLDTSFLETIGPSLLLPEDERHLSTIGLVHATDWEVRRSFQAFPFTLVSVYFAFDVIYLTLGIFCKH